MLTTRTPDFAVQMFLDRQQDRMLQAYYNPEARPERHRRREIRHERRHANRVLRAHAG